MTAFVLGVVGATAVAIAFAVLADEARAWMPYLARRLVRSAAAQLPPGDDERYRRDWLAELAPWNDRPLSALGKALHIRLSSESIRASLLGLPARDERLRRAIDVAVGSVLLVVFAPLLGVAAVAVAIDTRQRPFKLVRHGGRDGRSIRVLRFRQRPPGVPLLSSREGARTSWLELLPSLVNVVRGELSLVGPAPLFDLKVVEMPDPLRIRASVRPGVIDPFIIRLSPGAGNPSGDIDGFLDFIIEWMDDGVEYAQDRSLRRDLLLLLRLPYLLSSGSRRGPTAPGP